MASRIACNSKNDLEVVVEISALGKQRQPQEKMRISYVNVSHDRHMARNDVGGGGGGELY